MRITSLPKLHRLPEKSISDLTLESDFFPTSMEDWSEEIAHQRSTQALEPRPSDGDFNNLKNKSILKKTKKEMDSRLTPESFLMKEEELLTELPQKPSRIENDLQIYLTSIVTIAHILSSSINAIYLLASL